MITSFMVRLAAQAQHSWVIYPRYPPKSQTAVRFNKDKLIRFVMFLGHTLTYHDMLHVEFTWDYVENPSASFSHLAHPKIWRTCFLYSMYQLLAILCIVPADEFMIWDNPWEPNLFVFETSYACIPKQLLVNMPTINQYVPRIKQIDYNIL